MSLSVFDPDRGTCFREAVSGEGFLKYLYTTGSGRLTLEALVKRKLFQTIAGAYCSSRWSRSSIEGFAAQYGINLHEAVIPQEGFRHFNDFFARRLKPGTRPFDPAPHVLICPADGRVRVETALDPSLLLQIKGMTYPMDELIGEDASPWRGGTLFTIRLNPTDYHRYHYPTTGVDLGSRTFPGAYYSVNPMALARIPHLYLKNHRQVTKLATDRFGTVLFIEVGATSVGSIHNSHGEGPFAKGDEKGWFEFGGSTILLIIPPLPQGSLKIREDLLRQSELGIETLLRMGSSLAQIE